MVLDAEAPRSFEPTTQADRDAFLEDIHGAEPEFVLTERVDTGEPQASLERWTAAPHVQSLPEAEEEAF